MHSLMLSHTKAPGFLNAPAVSHLQGFAHAGPSVRPQTAHHTSCRKWDPTTSGPSVWIQGPREPSFEGLDFRVRRDSRGKTGGRKTKGERRYRTEAGRAGMVRGDGLKIK